MINVIDLFCGCGGFSKGFIDAGANVCMAVDYNDKAIETYKKNFPNVVAISEDIFRVNSNYIVNNIGTVPISIIIGGPPCKDLMIGSEGLNHPQNGLFLQFARIVKEVRPTAFIIENIGDITEKENGQIIKMIINHFESIGYDTENYVLHCNIYGIPQNKKRSIFVGLDKSKEIPKICFQKSIVDVVTASDALSDLPPLLSGKEYTTYFSRPKNHYQEKMRDNCGKLTEHHILKPSPALSVHRSLEERTIKANEPAPDLDTRKRHRDQIHYHENRLLTIREMARLQSFPDSFWFAGSSEDKISQIGNAIPPQLSKYIAEVIIKSINTLHVVDFLK